VIQTPRKKKVFLSSFDSEKSKLLMTEQSLVLQMKREMWPLQLQRYCLL